MAMMASPTNLDRRTIWQPLHPDVRQKLDTEYVAFHDQYAQYVQPDNTKPWTGAARTEPSLPPGSSPPVEVGQVRDVAVGAFSVRVYKPKGNPDANGWPVFVWFHGGGWAIGGLDDGMDLLTRICQGCRCLVVTVGYRLAPEARFPAAVVDAVYAMKWVLSNPPSLDENIDESRIGIGGTSAGANLAIVAALAVANPNVALPSTGTNPFAAGTALLEHPLACLVLIVPVVDNTATEKDVWKPNAVTAPWLTPARMEWYRRLYFTELSERYGWDASPNLAPAEMLMGLPPVWIAYADQDLLAPEAVAFGARLEGLGVKTTVQALEGCTHSILTLSEVMSKGKKLIEDSVEYIARAMGTT